MSYTSTTDNTVKLFIWKSIEEKLYENNMLRKTNDI